MRHLPAPRFLLAIFLLCSALATTICIAGTHALQKPIPKNRISPQANCPDFTQDLSNEGKLYTNPFAQTVDAIPDPRFLEAQDRHWQRAFEQQIKDPASSPALENLFDRYEEFLRHAVVISFVYADDELAQEYYDELRDKFGSFHPNEGTYLKRLPIFVLDELRGDSDTMTNARAMIDGLIYPAFTQGLANRRPHVFEQLIRLARELHRLTMKYRYPTAASDQDRTSLPPFDSILNGSFASFMRSARINPLVRLRAWCNAPLYLQQSTYEQIKPILDQQIIAMDPEADPATILPEPPGMADYRKLNPVAAPTTPDTNAR